MKKTIIVFSALTLLSLGSCKKDYTCTCKLYDSGGYTVVSTRSFTISATPALSTSTCMTQAQAYEVCNL